MVPSAFNAVASPTGSAATAVLNIGGRPMPSCKYPGCPKLTTWKATLPRGVYKRDRMDRFSYGFGDEFCGLHVRLVQERYDAEKKQPYAAIKFLLLVAAVAVIVGLVGAAIG